MMPKTPNVEKTDLVTEIGNFQLGQECLMSKKVTAVCCQGTEGRCLKKVVKLINGDNGF